MKIVIAHSKCFIEKMDDKSRVDLTSTSVFRKHCSLHHLVIPLLSFYRMERHEAKILVSTEHNMHWADEADSKKLKICLYVSIDASSWNNIQDENISSNKFLYRKSSGVLYNFTELAIFYYVRCISPLEIWNSLWLFRC